MEIPNAFGAPKPGMLSHPNGNENELPTYYALLPLFFSFATSVQPTFTNECIFELDTPHTTWNNNFGYDIPLHNGLPQPTNMARSFHRRTSIPEIIIINYGHANNQLFTKSGKKK